MKKSLLLIVFTLVIQCGFTQSKSKAFGLKGGINKTSGFKELGINASVFFRFGSSNNLNFQPELEFTSQPKYNYQYNNYLDSYTYEHHSLLKLPLVIKYYFNEVYVETGGLIGVDMDAGGGGVGVLGGIGMDINDKFCVGLRYESPDLWAYTYTEFRSSLSMRVGYIF